MNTFFIMKSTSRTPIGACIFLLYFFLWIPSPAQIEKIDSLKKLINTASNDTVKASHLMAMGDILAEFNPDTAMRVYKQAGQLYLKQNKLKRCGQTLLEVGWCNYLLGKYPEALEAYAGAIKVSRAINYKKMEGAALASTGIIYREQGNFVKAIECYLTGIRISEEANDKGGLAGKYVNLGVVYIEQKEYQKGLMYWNKALPLMKETGNDNGVAGIIGNMGSLYKEMGKPDSAIIYSLEAEKMNRKSGNLNYLTVNLSNIGAGYADLAKLSENKNKKQEFLQKAERAYNEAITINTKMGAAPHIVINRINLAALCYEKTNYTCAVSELDAALSLAHELGANNLIAQAEHLYSAVDSARGKFESALQHYKIYVSVNDSIKSEENVRKQTQSEMNFEFDKKTAIAKAEQEKKDLKNAEEKRQQRIVTWFVAGCLLLVVVIAVFIFRSLQVNKKKNKIISEQKELVERQKELVEEKQKEILDSIYYARRIQRALITNEKYINRNLTRLK